MSLVLGIETSCDETAIGIVRDRTLLANVISSSMNEHVRFGGVVPEIASRAHLEAFINVLEQALNDAKVKLSDIDAIAVTEGPGLIGALLVGVAGATGLATALEKPLYGVNHLTSHIAVDYLTHEEKLEPTIALLVSGGHSSLLQVNDITKDVRKLGATMDDAAGEAFDKIARVLNLGFPGGPAIDREATAGEINIDFPRGLTTAEDWRTRPYNFSFSGLKTSVARYIEKLSAGNNGINNKARADIAASFQEAVVDVLLQKSLRACKDNGIDRLVIAGGVAANSRLRYVATERCQKAGIRLHIPSPILCTDNGAMVASLGSLLLEAGARPNGALADSALSF